MNLAFGTALEIITDRIKGAASICHPCIVERVDRTKDHIFVVYLSRVIDKTKIQVGIPYRIGVKWSGGLYYEIGPMRNRSLRSLEMANQQDYDELLQSFDHWLLRCVDLLKWTNDFYFACKRAVYNEEHGPYVKAVKFGKTGIIAGQQIKMGDYFYDLIVSPDVIEGTYANLSKMKAKCTLALNGVDATSITFKTIDIKGIRPAHALKMIVAAAHKYAKKCEVNQLVVKKKGSAVVL